MTARLAGVLLLVAGCSSTSGGPDAASADASPSRVDAAHDAGAVRHHDAGRGALHDATEDAPRDVAADAGPDAHADVTSATTALVRLANWSPDAPGIDVCVAPHGSSAWSAPILAAALGRGPLGHLAVKDADLSKDAGAHGAPDAAKDARSGGHDAGVDAATQTGVLFLRMSPYIAWTAGAYDVRVVKADSTDCNTPLLPEIDDLPPLEAGSVQTFALVGDTVVEGSDPALSLASLPDDTSAAASSALLRFVNAIPTVIEVTFASGTVATGSAVPYLAATQFGSAGVDSDAGAIDSDDYLTIAPIADPIWSLINANGGVSTLVAVRGASVPAKSLATVVAVGGESGPGQNDIGILVCTDEAPIVAGETASCSLLQEAAQPVCGGGC